jgi:excisionase family DNA binding protein
MLRWLSGASSMVVMATKHKTNTRFPFTLSVAEAARILDVVPATAYQWVRDGELPSLRFGGRVRIPTAKLAELVGVDPAELVTQIESPA